MQVGLSLLSSFCVYTIIVYVGLQAKAACVFISLSPISLFSLLIHSKQQKKEEKKKKRHANVNCDVKTKFLEVVNMLRLPEISLFFLGSNRAHARTASNYLSISAQMQS